MRTGPPTRGGGGSSSAGARSERAGTILQRMSSRTNRRRHPRVESPDLVGHLKHGGQTQLGLGIENLSVGGLLLRTSHPLGLGAQVLIELARPGMKSFHLVGRVVGVAPLARPGPKRGTHGVSVRFNPQGDAVQAKLEELVRELTWGPRPSPAAPPTPVRAALAVPASQGRRPTEFDFDRSVGLADDALSEAVVGQAAAQGAKFDADSRHSEFDFDYQEPLSAGVLEPAPVPVPASARLTAQVTSREATAEELRQLLEERDREIQDLKDLLSKKNEHIEKLRRAVLELRHRNNPVL